VLGTDRYARVRTGGRRHRDEHAERGRLVRLVGDQDDSTRRRTDTTAGRLRVRSLRRTRAGTRCAASGDGPSTTEAGPRSPGGRWAGPQSGRGRARPCARRSRGRRSRPGDTGADGRFRIKVRPGVSRTIRTGFQWGGEGVFACGMSLSLKVRASVRLSAPRHVRVRGDIPLSGPSARWPHSATRQDRGATGLGARAVAGLPNNAHDQARPLPT
jgi:hypothetical protein